MEKSIDPLGVDAPPIGSGASDASGAWTEPRIQGLLVARFNSTGTNQWATFPNLRNSPGFPQRAGTIDFLAVEMWGTHRRVAVEIKTARSDWLRELEQPAKAWVFESQVHEFYVCAPPDVVRVHEVPETWGWMVAHAAGIQMQKRATRREAAQISEGLMLSLVRATAFSSAVPLAVFRYAGRELTADELVSIATEVSRTSVQRLVDEAVATARETWAADDPWVKLGHRWESVCGHYVTSQQVDDAIAAFKGTLDVVGIRSAVTRLLFAAERVKRLLPPTGAGEDS